MNAFTSREMLGAFRDSVDHAARWTRLLQILEIRADKPSARLLNDKLKELGFRRALDETAELGSRPAIGTDWWGSLAEEVAGSKSASLEQVLENLQKQKEKKRSGLMLLGSGLNWPVK